jgi:NADPH2:quinone reductase
MVALTVYYGNTQYVCLDEKRLVPVPEGVDSAEATSLVLNYITVYQMLHRIAKVQPGERVLIHGAAGGVGTALLQLGQLAGVQMYGTASRAKHPLLEQYGAIPIDYKAEDFVKRILTLTGDGVDAVFDPIGGTHLRQSFKTLRKGGRLVAYGVSSVVAQRGNRTTFLVQSLAMLGRLQWWSLLPNGKRASLYLVEQYPKWLQEDLAKLLALLAEGKIKPIIAQRLPLEQIAHAHELLETSQVEGKIVLLPNESTI